MQQIEDYGRFEQTESRTCREKDNFNKELIA